jgi:hypothetical protein
VILRSAPSTDLRALLPHRRGGNRSGAAVGSAVLENIGSILVWAGREIRRIAGRPVKGRWRGRRQGRRKPARGGGKGPDKGGAGDQMAGNRGWAGQAGNGEDGFFTPVSGFDLPRFAGVPTFMRLPHVPFDHPRFAEVEIGLIGAPWDGGTTNRPGPRHGPRQLRDLSTMIRAAERGDLGGAVRDGALRRPGRRGAEPGRPDGFDGADGGVL